MAKMNIKVEREIMAVLLDKVCNGHIVIPIFQRDFIWSSKQITEFFDSILRQYPIGSLILWKPEDDEFKTMDNLEGIKVDNAKSSDMSYILDGRQRITTLLSTLYEGGYNSHKYYINLEDDYHVVYRNRSALPTKFNLLCLSEAFDSFALVGYLERLRNSNLSETKKTEYATKAKEVNKKLMAYEISYTIVRGGNIEDAVEIFSRLNSKTSQISTDYMIQALAYNTQNDFLFADAITEIKQGLEEYGLGDISRDVILKCVYNYTDKYFVDGKAEDLLNIKDQLEGITTNLKEDAKHAAKFLNEECGVVDIRLLPYIYQFVMLALFFKYNKNTTALQTTDLKKWFFYTTYCSYFTSTSLSEIRNAIDVFSRYCKGEITSPIEYESKIDVAKLPENWSLGSVRACAYALSLVNKYRPEDVAIFDIYTIPGTGNRNAANIVCSFSKTDKSTLSHLLKDIEWDPNLELKFGITQEQFRLYHEKKIDKFLEERRIYNNSIEESFIKKIFENTGISIDGLTNSVQEYVLDRRIYALLQWLCTETDWYITHPLDIDRLQEVANFISDIKTSFNIDQIKECCRSLHWPEVTVIQIADAINEARTKRFNTLNRISKEHLTEIANNILS